MHDLGEGQVRMTCSSPIRTSNFRRRISATSEAKCDVVWSSSAVVYNASDFWVLLKVNHS